MKLLLLFTLIAQVLLAAPAFQGKRLFTQPDGTEVTYRLQGDEHLNWMESEGGDILLYSKKNKRLEFAEIKDNALQPSGVAFSKSDAAKAPSGTQRPQLSKDDLAALHAKKRDEHLSRMKSRHTEH